MGSFFLHCDFGCKVINFLVGWTYQQTHYGKNRMVMIFKHLIIVHGFASACVIESIMSCIRSAEGISFASGISWIALSLLRSFFLCRME